MTTEQMKEYRAWDSYDLYNSALSSNNEAFKRYVLMTLKERGNNDDLIFSLAVNYA